MSKKTKIWLIMAASLVVVGLIIFASVMQANGWDFTKLSTVNYQTNTYEIAEDFSQISIETDTADIVFAPSDGGKSKVVCTEQTNLKHTVAVEDGILKIGFIDEREWYEYIGISMGNSQITVYLSENEYNSLFIDEDTGDIEISDDFKFQTIDISTSTGDIDIRGVEAKDIDLSVSTGHIFAQKINCEENLQISVSTGKTELKDIVCKSFSTQGDTGDIRLENVIVAEKITAERSTGDIFFDQCDAAELYVATDTGDVKGNLLSDKIFYTETDTGRVDVPKSTVGGICEITTDTGNIIFK